MTVLLMVCRASRAPRRCRVHLGTTGEPKGVIGTNAAVGACRHHLEHAVTPAASPLARPPPSTRLVLRVRCGLAALLGLLDGHALHLFDDEEIQTMPRHGAAIATQQIDMIDTTPSMFAQLRAAGLLDAGRSRCWRWAARCSAACVGVNPCGPPAADGLQLLWAHRNDRRGGGGAGREYAEPTIGRPTQTPATCWIQSLRTVPTGVVGVALPGRRPAGPGLPRPITGTAAVRGRPLRPGQTYVSNR